MEHHESGDWDGNELEYKPAGRVETIVACIAAALPTILALGVFVLWAYSHYAT